MDHADHLRGAVRRAARVAVHVARPRPTAWPTTARSIPSKTPVTMTCTAAGTTLFIGANCANPIVVNQGWVYPAIGHRQRRPRRCSSTASGNIYAATRTYSDGREALALTFAQASYYNSYLELAYGLVSWATRGVFIGERHVYAVPQLDDLFLASDIYGGGTYRITDADLQALADWQNGKRAKPQFAGFRIAWAANGYGSQTHPGDPLTAKAITMGPTFAWINHTWDHPILDKHELRGRAERVHEERHLSEGAAADAVRDDQRGDAQHLGAGQRGRHAGHARRRDPVPGQRHVRAGAGRTRRRTSASGTRSSRAFWRFRASRPTCTSTSRSRPSGSRSGSL